MVENLLRGSLTSRSPRYNGQLLLVKLGENYGTKHSESPITQAKLSDRSWQMDNKGLTTERDEEA